MEKKAELRTEDVAEAFEQGVDAAYRAVMKPVEGTILTVAREASVHLLICDLIVFESSRLPGPVSQVLATVSSLFTSCPTLEHNAE